MIRFYKCCGYLALIGILAHFVGEALPRQWFAAERFPWKATSWERNGKIYDRLHIRAWMNHLPDMSRILPDMVPKRIDGVAKKEHIDRLIRETCVAEITHSCLIVIGFGCTLIWPGLGGWIVSLLFALGNLPFILIQRYNRPRLCRLHVWLIAREGEPATSQQSAQETVISHENTHIDM